MLCRQIGSEAIKSRQRADANGHAFLDPKSHWQHHGLRQVLSLWHRIPNGQQEDYWLAAWWSCLTRKIRHLSLYTKHLSVVGDRYDIGHRRPTNKINASQSFRVTGIQRCHASSPPWNPTLIFIALAWSSCSPLSMRHSSRAACRLLASTSNCSISAILGKHLLIMVSSSRPLLVSQ